MPAVVRQKFFQRLVWRRRPHRPARVYLNPPLSAHRDTALGYGFGQARQLNVGIMPWPRQSSADIQAAWNPGFFITLLERGTPGNPGWLVAAAQYRFIAPVNPAVSRSAKLLASVTRAHTQEDPLSGYARWKEPSDLFHGQRRRTFGSFF